MYKNYNFSLVKFKYIIFAIILVKRIIKFFFKYTRTSMLVKKQYNNTKFKNIYNKKIWLKKKKLSDYLLRHDGEKKILIKNNIYNSKLNDYYKFRIKSINKIFYKYCTNKELVELGCGSGEIAFSLLLSKNYKKIYGYDISKYGINTAKSISNVFHIKHKCTFKQLDIRKNFKEVNFKNKTVYTHHCLEQLKNNAEKIIKNLLKTNFDRCIHIEPSLELLSNFKISDICTKLYIKEHGYLDNLITILNNLEKEKKIKIITKKLFFYSPNLSYRAHLVVWEKIKKN